MAQRRIGLRQSQNSSNKVRSSIDLRWQARLIDNGACRRRHDLLFQDDDKFLFVTRPGLENIIRKCEVDLNLTA